jgi:hypothetical protein
MRYSEPGHRERFVDELALVLRPGGLYNLHVLDASP